MSSVRRLFEFRTPFVTAGIEGTEALIAVEGPRTDSLVLVREGRIRAVDRRGGAAALALGPGDAAFANAETPLRAATPATVPERFVPLLLRPAGAADWAVHYSPVLLGADVDSAPVRAAAEALQAGRPDRADALLEGLDLPPRPLAAALALRAMAAVFRNDRERGLSLAREAVAADPGLGAAHVALSHALQAAGRIEAARDVAAKGAALSSGDAHAWARLAELELTLGAYRRAREALARSLALGETALARTVEGFLELAAARRAAAIEAFGRAIRLESNAPLPRLGLGIAKIRGGALAAGRAEIETAVALDPRRADLRTWLGRAYFEENRPEKARAQYAIALEEDPDAPTPRLFSALERFAANDPVGALGWIESAEGLGDARATLRGPAGLGEDRAVRGAALARVYDTLGFAPLARRTGAAAAERDPGNPEAHFFLSDAFLGRQNLEAAQSSSLLLGQILSPPNRRLVQPRLAEADLGLLALSGPSRPTFAEFSPLITGDGLSFGVSGRLGTQSTFGVESSAAVLAGPVSLALGQFHSETDGFLANNDVEHDILSLEARAQLGPALTFFGELRRRDSEQGDRAIEFGERVEPFLRDALERNSLRAGLHLEAAPGHDLIAFATLADLQQGVSDCSVEPDAAVAADFAAEQEGFDLQARYLGRLGRMRVTARGSLSRTDQSTRQRLAITPAVFGPCAPDAPRLDTIEGLSEGRIEHESGYGYVTFELLDGVEGTLGLAVESFERPGFSATEVNPKVGLRVAPAEGLSFRAAYARTLKKPLILDQTAEPVTIAGFPQVFDDGNGAVGELVGLGIDARAGRRLWLGMELTRRWIDTPVDTLSGEGGPSVAIEETRETALSAHASATLGSRWALSAELRHQRFRLLRRQSELPLEADTTALPVSLRWFHPSGVFASADLALVHQRVRETAAAPSRTDEGVLLGGSVGYRLPAGRGVIALEAANLLDQDLLFRDQAFNTPRPQGLAFARDRAVFLTATFSFGRPGF